MCKIGHLRPRRRENVWMCRDHCTHCSNKPHSQPCGRVERLTQRMTGRTCVMRCLLIGPRTWDARLPIAREKSRCCSKSHSKVVAEASLLCGRVSARCWNGPTPLPTLSTHPKPTPKTSSPKPKAEIGNSTIHSSPHNLRHATLLHSTLLSCSVFSRLIPTPLLSTPVHTTLLVYFVLRSTLLLTTLLLADLRFSTSLLSIILHSFSLYSAPFHSVPLYSTLLYSALRCFTSNFTSDRNSLSNSLYHSKSNTLTLTLNLTCFNLLSSALLHSTFLYFTLLCADLPRRTRTVL